MKDAQQEFIERMNKSSLSCLFWNEQKTEAPNLLGVISLKFLGLERWLLFVPILWLRSSNPTESWEGFPTSFPSLVSNRDGWGKEVNQKIQIIFLPLNSEEILSWRWTPVIRKRLAIHSKLASFLLTFVLVTLCLHSLSSSSWSWVNAACLSYFLKCRFAGKAFLGHHI